MRHTISDSATLRAFLETLLRSCEGQRLVLARTRRLVPVPPSLEAEFFWRRSNLVNTMIIKFLRHLTVPSPFPYWTPTRRHGAP